MTTEDTLSLAAQSLLRWLGRSEQATNFERSAAQELVLHGLARHIHSEGIVEITPTGRSALRRLKADATNRNTDR